MPTTIWKWGTARTWAIWVDDVHIPDDQWRPAPLNLGYPPTAIYAIAHLPAGPHTIRYLARDSGPATFGMVVVWRGTPNVYTCRQDIEFPPGGGSRQGSCPFTR